jgi:cytochrome c-type biogenesis protein CcmE
MDPSRKRRIRLVVSLSVAVLLAAGLVYTSFSASTEAREPSEIIGSTSGSTYELTGKVVNGTVVRRGEDLHFRIRDREGTENLSVSYSGTIPDAFREGREVIVTGSLAGGVFVAERDSLVTKCPSKFTAEEKS